MSVLAIKDHQPQNTETGKRRPGNKSEKPMIVRDQKSREVGITNGGEIPIGTFLEIGDSAVAQVTGHTAAVTNALILFERDEKDGQWKEQRTSVLNFEATKISKEKIEVLQKQLIPKGVEIGIIRQPHLEVPALVPALCYERFVVIGKSRSGKTEGVETMTINFRNKLERFVKENKVDRVKYRVPGTIYLDIHGDALGIKRDKETGKLRPSLRLCLDVEPIVVGSKEFRCHYKEIPVSLLKKCLGPLSEPQARWCNKYAAKEDDYEGIEALLGDPADWPDHFPDLVKDEVIAGAQNTILMTLRDKFSALIQEPLFTEPKLSTWSSVLDQAYLGHCIVVDLYNFPEAQQPIVAKLVMQSIRQRQETKLRGGERCYPINVMFEEIHKFPQIKQDFENFTREIGKFEVGVTMVSQCFTEFPEDLIDNIDHFIVMKVSGKTRKRVMDQCPQLKPYEHEIDFLKPGDGYYIGKGICWPLRFVSPEIVR